MNTQNTTDRVATHMHDAIGNAQHNVTGIASKAAELKEQSLGTVNALGKQVERVAAKAIDAAKESGEKAIGYYETVSEATCEYVAEKPLKSMLIAAGIGAVVTAALMSRRSAR